ncbi:hypothetical protein CDCA_CDCA11G3173 [Cyanidium caldarium]|uniref:DNA mismatch repair protein S5 domain-containing protein n=1 Tax=Cyanidium caldarium TaxID=2771 RepID=A0AAV9IXV6_CYACA|nr:hypothetical protein CDCA_CDCA11G3173 [Cyanidium caldarium]
MSARIHRLDPEVVDRIAAGEVILRPAAALKELLENALDASATQIVVTVAQGGLRRLEVSDNGCGICREDFPLLCERFATSKIRHYDDLLWASTLGFRGEALASISYVARVSIRSRTEADECGWTADFVDGQVSGASGEFAIAVAASDGLRPCTRTRGTTVAVTDLFYNVPARRQRFWQSRQEEYRLMLAVMTRYAIYHSGRVSVILRKTDREGAAVSTADALAMRADLHTLRGATHVDNVRAAFGTHTARHLRVVPRTPLHTVHTGSGTGEVVLERALFSVAGFSMRKPVHMYFVNGRAVECGALRKALDAVYARVLMKGEHYPFCYVELRLPSDAVDVNVHPTKQEVQFVDEAVVVRAVAECAERVILGSADVRTLPVAQPRQHRIHALSSAGMPNGGPESDGEADPRAAHDSRCFTAPLPAQPVAPGTAAERLLRVVKRARVAREQVHAPTTLPSQRVRTDANAQTLETVMRQEKRDEAAIPASTSDADATPTPVRRSFGGDLVVQELKRRVQQKGGSAVAGVFRNQVFVGVVDERYILLQYETALVLADAVAIARHLLYQRWLSALEATSVQVVQLQPALALRPWTEAATAAAGASGALVEQVLQQLSAVAPFLHTRFQLHLCARRECTLATSAGVYCDTLAAPHPETPPSLYLHTLPAAPVPGIDLHLGALPDLLLPLSRLDSPAADRGERTAEQLHSAVDALAHFYAHSMEMLAREEGADYLRHQQRLTDDILPLTRQPACFTAPAAFRHDGTLRVVARLERLYRVFERC